MAFRFHKAFRLGKLVRLNVGKKSASVSVGVPGFRVNVGSQGSRATFGVPGTGLSYSTRLGASSMVNPAPPKSTGSGCLTLVMLAVLGMWALTGLVKLVESVGDPKANAAATIGATAFLMACTIALWVWLVRRKNRAAAAQQAMYAAELQRQHDEWQRQQALHAAEQEAERQRRWARLVERFGQGVAQQIWAQRLWVGASVAAVQEMFGPPLDVDEKVMKTKTKYTYKYNAIGVNRYALRVFIENDEVTGWEDKRD